MTFETQEQAAHLNDFPLARQHDWTATKIVAVYAVLGSLWILFSDRLVEDLVADPGMVNTLGTLKGWGYILVTALLLYSLIQAYTAALREREERLRLALMATNQGLYDLDVQTGEARTSPEYAALLGYDPAGFRENEASWTERLHPDDRQRVVETYHAYLRGDIPAYAVECRQRTQSGEWKWMQSMGRIVEHDTEGRPLRMLGTQSDISARKRAEAERETAVTALRESERKLRTLFEILPVGISILDAQRQVMAVNPALEKILEVSSEELRSGAPQTRHYIRPDHTLMPAAEFASVRALNEQTAVHDIETGIMTEAGRVIWANVSAVPVSFPDWRVVVVTSNITERKHAEEEVLRLNQDLEERVAERTAQLEEANQELEAFSYSVSHDLRAPLRAIHGFSRVLLRNLKDELPPENQRYLDLIQTNAQQMSDLIDALLAFSRLGRKPVEKQPVDMQRLVEQVLNELNTRLEGRQVKVNLDPLGFCQCDPALLKQVWVNLLSNALKYTRARDLTVIKIGRLEQPDEIVYFIGDNGVGFDMRYVHKLFGVFQRLHRAEDYEGTGVGLALVERIVRRHGGRVWAEGAVEQGATFYLALPW